MNIFCSMGTHLTNCNPACCSTCTVCVMCNIDALHRQCHLSCSLHTITTRWSLTATLFFYSWRELKWWEFNQPVPSYHCSVPLAALMLSIFCGFFLPFYSVHHAVSLAVGVFWTSANSFCPYFCTEKQNDPLRIGYWDYAVYYAGYCWYTSSANTASASFRLLAKIESASSPFQMPDKLPAWPVARTPVICLSSAVLPGNVSKILSSWLWIMESYVEGGNFKLFWCQHYIE